MARKLIVLDPSAPDSIAFRLTNSEGDIEVYANDIYLGCFVLTDESKIRFITALIEEENHDAVDVNEKNELATA